ncbi:MAG: hypothetical protein ACI4RD_02580 [Kiritimatiellia bacterium]
MNLRICLSTALAALGMTAVAKDFYWTGPASGGALKTLANWADADGAEPTEIGEFTGCGIVFTNETPISIVNDSHSETAAWTPKSIRVTRADVTFCPRDGNLRSVTYLWGYWTAYPTIEVAAGATFSCTNGFRMAHGSTRFMKTGLGVLELNGNFDDVSSSSQTTVEAGELRFVATSDLSPQVLSTKVIVSAGAKLSMVGNSVNLHRNDTKQTAALELGAGATLELNGTTCTVTGLTGDGSVVATAGTASYLVTCSDLASFAGTLAGNLYLATPAGSENVVTIGADASFLDDILGIAQPDGFAFATDVGSFALKYVDGSKGGTLHLRDTAGAPIALTTAVVNPAKLTIDGPGSLTVTASVQFVSSRYLATGELRVTSGTLQLGDATAGNDFTIGGGGAPGLIAVESAATLRLRPGESHVLAVPVRCDGALRVYSDNAGRRVTFSDLRNLTADGVISEFGSESVGNWGLSGGQAALPESLIVRQRSAYAELISGGSWAGAFSLTPFNGMRTLAQPAYVSVSGAYGWNSVEVTGGFFKTSLGLGMKNLYLRGGRADIKSRCWMCVGDRPFADGGRSQLVFDGGLATMSRTSGETYLRLFDTTAANVARTVVYVTDKGGRLWIRDDVDGTGMCDFYCSVPIEVCTNVVESGRFELRHSGVVELQCPMQLNGPVVVADGEFRMTASNVDPETGSLTGAGELTLANATLRPYDTSASLAVAVPGGLAFAGGALVKLSSTKHHALTVGALRRSGPGSALMVYTSDTSLPFGEADGPSFKVTTAPANDPATGAIALPVFVATGSDQRYAGFARYDAELGLVPFTDYADDFGQAAADRYVRLGKSGASIGKGETVEVAGLCFTQTSWAHVNLSDGACLKVGNGTDPAAILLDVGGCLNGDGGTVDFGGSEGLFVIPTSHQGTANQIGVRLSGSNGVSYFCFNNSTDQKVAVNNANDYAGQTHVWGVDLYAQHAAAFSSGEVVVGAGWGRGGRVIFSCEGATFANAFTVGGRGNSHTTDSSSVYGDDFLNYRRGALSFVRNATVSGAVRLTEETRVTVSPDVTGVISGVVSGDKLEVYRPLPDREPGELRLTAANAYTGGTEVVAANLTLATGDSAGTGEVVLDQSVLTFANASATTFANSLRGTGAVRLSGAGEVTFAGDTTRFSGSLDLTERRYVFTSVPPFSSVRAAASRVEITLAAPGDYDLSGVTFEGQVTLVLAPGATIDLKGGTLDVWRFRGDRSAVSGTVRTQVPDRTGLLLLVR